MWAINRQNKSKREDENNNKKDKIREIYVYYTFNC